MSLEKTNQDLTLHGMRIHGSITLRSMDRAIDRIERCRWTQKPLTLLKTAQAHDHKHYFGAGP